MVEREVLDLEPIISEIVDEFAPQARDKGLVLQVEGTACGVLADRALLERILRNLIANAVRYTEQGRIVVRARREGAQQRIAVADTGRGIPAAEQASIFEEFRKLDNADRDPRKGLGLGLAIVKRAADLLDTQVTVVSAPGTGAEFSLLLPGAALSAEAHSRAAARPVVHAIDELQGMHVLVVDDDLGIRRGMRTLLQDWGCDVRCCAGHDDALALVDGGYHPHAIIADLHLAGHHDGLDTIRALRTRHGAALPAIIITGEVQPDVVLSAGEAPVPMLRKPAPPSRIRSFLRSVHRRRRDAAAAAAG